MNIPLQLVVLIGIPNPLGGLRRAVGALPDAIAGAIFNFIRRIADAVLSGIIDYSVGPLLDISNPMGSAQALTAWSDVASIAIAVLPILVVMNLVAWPFGEQNSGSLWEIVLRGLAVILFIGISRPLWGFAIDATNQITLALLPTSFNMANPSDSLGILGGTATLFLLPIIAILAFIGFTLTMLLLLLRWYLVWVVFVGTPLFAVMWYPNKGPFKSVSKYGSTFLRMGAYSLLAGPVIALVVKVFALIAGGGMITGRSGISGTVLEFGVTLALVLLMPLMIFLVSYKVIAWAGQPMGVGAVVGATIVAAAAAASAGTAMAGGGAVGGAGAAGAGGSAAGGSGGAGGASGASGASAAGKGATAAGEAIDPSAATDGTSIGSGIRQSIGDAMSANREQSDIEANAPGVGQKMVSSAKESISDKASGGKAGSAVTRAKGAASGAKDAASHVTAGAAYHGSGSSVVDRMRKVEAAATDKAATHRDNADFIASAGESKKIDMQEAVSRGIVPQDAQPAEHVSSVPVNTIRASDKDGADVQKATYRGEDGSFKTIDLSEARDSQLAKADEHMSEATSAASRTKSARAIGQGSKTAVKAPGKIGVKAGKAYGKTVVAGSKIGAAAMIGGVTQNPYMGMKAGQYIGGSRPSNRAKEMLIGSNMEQSAGRSSTVSMGGGVGPDEQEDTPDYDGADSFR